MEPFFYISITNGQYSSQQHVSDHFKKLIFAYTDGLIAPAAHQVPVQQEAVAGGTRPPEEEEDIDGGTEGDDGDQSGEVDAEEIIGKYSGWCVV